MASGLFLLLNRIEWTLLVIDFNVFLLLPASDGKCYYTYTYIRTMSII